MALSSPSSISFRALAGELSKPFGRTEPAGHLFAGDAVALGYVAGRRGVGERATSAHAALLILAMATRLPRMQSLRHARDIGRLPFQGWIRYDDKGHSIGAPDLPPIEMSFGDFLAGLIDCFRDGVVLPPGVEFHEINFGSADGQRLHGTLQILRYVTDEHTTAWVKDECFFMSADEPASVPAIYSRSFTYVPASALQIAAQILGPLPAASSGGGGGKILVPVLDNLEPAEDLPIAAHEPEHSPAAEA